MKLIKKLPKIHLPEFKFPKPRKSIIYIFVAIIFSVIIVFPDWHIKLNWPIKVDKTYSFSNINFSIAGINVEKKIAMNLGLDLQGGTRLVLEADMKDIPNDRYDVAIESARNVIEKRVNLFGISEHTVRTAKTADTYNIVVELAGVKDVNEAVKLVGKTAKLEFLELKKDVKLDDPEVIYDIKSYESTGITGDDLDGAYQGLDPETKTKPIIQLDFSTEGEKKFSKTAEKNRGSFIAIVLDDEMVSVPYVNPDYQGGGDPYIEGSFDLKEAEVLATQLNAGALPIPIKVIEQRSIGASLGQDALRKSMMAGAIGIILIMIFMVYEYKKYGLIADLALGIYTLFSIAIFKFGIPAPVLLLLTGEVGDVFFVPVTLTLAGIAGFLLSIGMAVDANILIFERAEEEERNGQKNSLELGFKNAWPSIRDANISTILTCAILGIFFGDVPVVRGFAITLAVGVLLSLLTAILITRELIKIFYKK